MPIRFAPLSAKRLLLGCAGSILIAGCASTPPPRPPARPVPPPQADNTVRLPPSVVYKIGDPYQINNIWYYPHEQPDYDETGIASWYGPTFYGKRTADGEMYDGAALTAAHKTLPLPVNVRVTNLDNGKSIVVRVNDRGPYAQGRIIDLSRHAAELLDVVQTGTARVRVTYLGRADLAPGVSPGDETPPEIASALPAAPTSKVDSSSLPSLQGAGVAPPVQVSALPAPVVSAPIQPVSTEPTGHVDKLPVPANTHLYVQVGAFSNAANARRLAASLGGDLRISTLQRGGQTLYRVRTGPLASVEDADAALARLSGQATDARIVVDQ